MNLIKFPVLCTTLRLHGANLVIAAINLPQASYRPSSAVWLADFILARNLDATVLGFFEKFTGVLFLGQSDNMPAIYGKTMRNFAPRHFRKLGAKFAKITHQTLLWQPTTSTAFAREKRNQQIQGPISIISGYLWSLTKTFFISRMQAMGYAWGDNLEIQPFERRDKPSGLARFKW